MNEEMSRVFEKKESIELSLNAKGEYRWKIVVVPKEGEYLTDDDMERLNSRNKVLEKEYGRKTKN